MMRGLGKTISIIAATAVTMGSHCQDQPDPCSGSGDGTWSSAGLVTIVQEPIPCPVRVTGSSFQWTQYEFIVAAYDTNDVQRWIPTHEAWDCTGQPPGFWNSWSCLRVFNELRESALEYSGQSCADGIPASPCVGSNGLTGIDVSIWLGAPPGASHVVELYFAGTYRAGSNTNYPASGVDSATVVAALNTHRYSAGWAAGYEVLEYTRQYGVSAGVNNNSPDPYSWVTASFQPVHSNYVSPLSYSWRFNGSTTCGNNSTCQRQVGGAGSYNTWDLTTTDAQGRIASASVTVQVDNSGCSGCFNPPPDRNGR